MGTPLRLLMLEDNPSDAELVLHALRRAGYDPIAARVETEQDYREHLHPTPEIILADFAMPQFDSLRALEIIQEYQLDIPFIIVSGTIGDERAVEVMHRGATDYLIKDRLGRLGQAVTQALEQKHLREAKRRAEQALCESESLLRNAFDYTNVAMVVIGLDYRFVRANGAFVEMFGFSQPEILKLSMSDLTHPDDLAESDALLKALLAGESRYFQIEKRYVHKDGHVLWGLANMSLLHDAQGKPLHFVGQVQDITQRVAAGQALRESQEKSQALEEQYRQSQKMEAVGQLAAGVAHDFNNLLTIILGYAQLFLGNLPPTDPGREPMGQILKAAERAAALTRQLLAFGRKQILSPVVLDLNSLLTELEKMLRRLIGADIELTTVFQSDLGRVKVDSGQVEQIIINLVVNACDAMPGGGRLTIHTDNTCLSELQVRQHAELPPGPYALLAVTDTGSGMDEATKARVFEPFFTTKEVGKGTGLGLATVFGIIKQSGGFIEVDSVLGSGSTFRIYLPQIRETACLEEAAHGQVKMPRGVETILLVEDEDRVRELAQMVLEASGYKVLSTRNGGEAMEVGRDYADIIQLLLTDVVMPKMSGRQLTDVLVPSRPSMKVLYMSGYTDDTMVRHGIEDAGMGFLAKPFTPVALAQKVRDVLDGPNGHQRPQ
jgi:two-component system cell cycle sensor histidine kinase/response regulator CckA